MITDTGEFALTDVDLLSGHLAGALKNGGAAAAKAIRKMCPPDLSEPDEPGKNATSKQKIIYKHKLKKPLKDQDTGEDMNGRIFKKFKEHYAKSMMSKLQGMAAYDALSNDQGGIRLVKLPREIYFEQDGSRQKLVTSDRMLIMCW